jgi:hypothetical protein
MQVPVRRGSHGDHSLRAGIRLRGAEDGRSAQDDDGFSDDGSFSLDVREAMQ